MNSSLYKHQHVEMGTDIASQPPSELANGIYRRVPGEEPKEVGLELPPQELPADSIVRSELSPAQSPRRELPDTEDTTARPLSFADNEG